MKVGTLTIGQSPRTEVIPGIREALGPNVEIVEKGALDGLNLEEVKRSYSPTERLHPCHKNVGA